MLKIKAFYHRDHEDHGEDLIVFSVRSVREASVVNAFLC